MPEQTFPVRNAVGGHIFGLMFQDASDAGSFLVNPPLATGDVTICKDFTTGFTNIATLPVVTPASTELVKVTLSQTEIDCDHLMIKFVDQTTPKAWPDFGIEIRPRSEGAMIFGTVDTAVASTTTTFEADDITEATADHYNGRIVIFTSGILVGQATDITDYALNGGKGAFTVTALTEAPGNNDTFIIV